MGCEGFRDRMLDVLYGEADAASARAWEDHQRDCAACGDEMRALRGVRRDLAAWTPPARRGTTKPGLTAWLPVAAGLALALLGGAALLQSQQQVDRLAAALSAHDARHRAEIDALRAQATNASGDATLAEVRRLLRESEARQALVLDASLRGLAERSDAQRREDMAQVSAGFSYLEGRTGLQVARTTELMGHVLQASQGR